MHFIYLSGDRLYTELNNILYVYLISDFSSSIATYHLGSRCRSGIIADNFLYLGVGEKLHVFKETPSLAQPLIPVKKIATRS